MKSLKEFMAESKASGDFAFDHVHKHPSWGNTGYHITGRSVKLSPDATKDGYKAHYVEVKRDDGVKQSTVILHKKGKILSHHSLNVQAEQAADIHRRTGSVPKEIQDRHGMDSSASDAIHDHIAK